MNEKQLKPLPRKVRGVATIDEECGVVFKPYKEGDTKRENVKNVRASSFYTTAGERKQTKVCHLTADADALDPVAEMLEDFCKLTKHDLVEAFAAARGKKLCETQQLRIIANKAKGIITTTIILDLHTELNYEKILFQQFQEILKCFTTNQHYLRNLVPAQKKCSEP